MTFVALFGAVKAQDRMKRLQLWDTFQNGQPPEAVTAREHDAHQDAEATM